VRQDGTCPTCGHRFDAPSPSRGARRRWFRRWPWYVTLIVVVFVVYVAFRMYEVITLLIDQL
jgi:hypothetical protein